MAKSLNRINAVTSRRNKAEVELTNLLLLTVQAVISGPRRGLKPAARRLEAEFAGRLSQVSAA
jgi:hypothetical protein